MQPIKYTHPHSKRVRIARSFLYGQHSDPPAARALADLVDDTLKILDWTLSIPDDITYIVTKLRGRTAGVYSPQNKQVVIDGRETNLDRLIKIICHETVHVDQVARGDLAWTNVGDAIWCGKLYPGISHYSHSEYLKSPWELEAFSQQDRLAEVVLHHKHR